ncbi:MAG: carbonic anhydrase family protein [Puia sp.]|nr:carbonic anhydrase family protein [Puia sp.]
MAKIKITHCVRGACLAVCLFPGLLLSSSCDSHRRGESAGSSIATDTPAKKTPDIITEVTTAEFQDSITPLEVLGKFKAGNRRFLEGRMLHRNYLSQVDLSSKGQHPYAVIVSCIDSRKPAEIVFDKGIGDMFNARIAGNFVNTDILGSLEFACKVSGAKLILVMGHSDCGAIKSACDRVKLGNITAMLANITPAVDAVKGFPGNRSSKNQEFVAAVAKQNVLIAIAKILKESVIIREMVSKGQVMIAGCMYDLRNGSVDFYP